MSNSVLVIDTNKQPQLPVNPGMARRFNHVGFAYKISWEGSLFREMVQTPRGLF